MTAILDFLFGLFSLNIFSWDCSEQIENAILIEEPWSSTIYKVLKEHMLLDPATAQIEFDKILVKCIGKKILYLVALHHNRKVFTYFCKNEFAYLSKKIGVIQL